MPPRFVGVREIAREFNAETQVLAELDVGAQWSRLTDEFLSEWTRLQRSGEDVERGMQAFLDGLSEKPQEDLARKSASVAYNEGRDAEIKTAGLTGEVQAVVRTAVLDANTCEECVALDGSVYEVGTEEYEANLPPAKCLGGDRCRCFYVPLTSEAVA